MATYEVRLVSLSGRIIWSDTFQAANDIKALGHARQAPGSEDILEVRRVICSIPGQPITATKRRRC